MENNIGRPVYAAGVGKVCQTGLTQTIAAFREVVNCKRVNFVVESFCLWRPALRAPADEHVLEAAINGQAEAIVTFNVRHFALATVRFGIQLLRPGEVLRRLEQ